MQQQLKQDPLNESLAASGITTVVELAKAMKSSKMLSAMVFLRCLVFAGFILLLFKTAGA